MQRSQWVNNCPNISTKIQKHNFLRDFSEFLGRRKKKQMKKKKTLKKSYDLIRVRIFAPLYTYRYVHVSRVIGYRCARVTIINLWFSVYRYHYIRPYVILIKCILYFIYSATTTTTATGRKVCSAGNSGNHYYYYSTGIYNNIKFHYVYIYYYDDETNEKRRIVGMDTFRVREISSGNVYLSIYPRFRCDLDVIDIARVMFRPAPMSYEWVFKSMLRCIICRVPSYCSVPLNPDEYIFSNRLFFRLFYVQFM